MASFLARADVAAGEEIRACTSTMAPALDSAGDAMGPAVPVLVPVDAGALQLAVEAFDRACNLGYVWCSMDSVQAYELAPCDPGNPPAPELMLEDIIQALGKRHRSLMGVHFERGRVLDRSGLLDTPFFSTTYSPAGPDLLASMDAFAGDVEVKAWLLSRRLACHNCSEFRDTGVLWYPATGVVIVLRGMHGYDS